MHFSTAQVKFAFPIDTPLSFSGTFGELRSNHYHSGLDFKTEGKEGRSVKAAADGWVSRIKMSAVGFGNVIYLDHPSGHTTVYAHLHHFNSELMAYLDSAQYTAESFEMELFPDSGRFSYLLGQEIGISGNTGGSQGPHLHFEIRDRLTQIPQNPFIFLPPIKDTIPPRTGVVTLFNKDPRFNFFSFLDSSSINNHLFHVNVDTVYISMYADDKSGENKLGIYAMQLFQDDSLLYTFKYDQFNFDETKYVNAHVHPTGVNGTDGLAHQLFKLPGDRFSVYHNAGLGKMVLRENDTARFQLKVFDYVGGSTIFLFEIVKHSVLPSPRTSVRKVIPYNQPFEQKGGNGVKLNVPANALYQDLPLTKIGFKKSKTHLSNIYSFLDSLKAPLHYTAKIQLPFKAAPEIAPEKIQLLRLNPKTNNIEEYISPDTLIKELLKARIRKAGFYCVGFDTIAPIIEPIFHYVDTIDLQDYYSCKISDKQSGISKYRVTANQQWILASYDAKSGLLRWKKSRTEFRLKTFNIEVEDYCKNKVMLEWRE
jgi:Peptidase family M23